MKGKNQKKTKAKKAPPAEPAPKMFAMGYVDLLFRVDLTEKDMEKPEDESKDSSQEEKKETPAEGEEGEKKEDDKHYKLEDLNSIKALKYWEDRHDIWDKIQFTPNNETVKQLMIGNKVLKKKCEIDFIGFGRPKFEGDEEFFAEIFDYVLGKNGLTINQKPLDEGGRHSLRIDLYYKNEIQSIQIGKSPEDAEKEKKKKKKEEEKSS